MNIFAITLGILVGSVLLNCTLVAIFYNLWSSDRRPEDRGHDTNLIPFKLSREPVNISEEVSPR